MEWALRAMGGSVKGGHFRHRTGRTIEQVLSETGWIRVDIRWRLYRRARDPATKYNRDYNTITYHSPDDRWKVWVTYIVGSRPAMCKCGMKPLDEKKKK